MDTEFIDAPVFLGQAGAPQLWVFLCGLNKNFHGDEAKASRGTLNALGKERELSFLALPPIARGTRWAGRLHWPQDTDEDVRSTWRSIQRTVQKSSDEYRRKVPKAQIAGYIGFSNGGFFLCKLAQLESLPVPLIAVASGGRVSGVPCENSLTLLVGDKDEPYVSHAQEMANSAEKTPLCVTLTEFSGGHVLPGPELGTLLEGLRKK